MSVAKYVLVVNSLLLLFPPLLFAQDDTGELDVTAVYDNGFRLQTDDGNYQFEINGRLQAESGYYTYPDTSPLDGEDRFDAFNLGRAEFSLGTVIAKYYQAKISADLANRIRLKSAYLNLRFLPAVQLKVGQFEYPFGNENLGSSKYAEFVGSTTITGLAGSQDRGALLYGSPFDGFLHYQAGLVKGAGSTNDDNNASYDLVSRLVVNPTGADADFFQTWLGLSLAYGAQTGTDGEEIVLETETPSELPLFVADIPTGNEYDRTKIGVDTVFLVGPAMFKSELIFTNYQFNQNATVSGGYVLAGFFLTGEQRSIKNGLFTRQYIESPLDPETQGWGAWELTVRYSWFAVDELFFQPRRLTPTWQGVATENIQQGSALTLGLNWFPQSMLMLMLNGVVTTVQPAASKVSNAAEYALTTAMHLEF